MNKYEKDGMTSFCLGTQLTFDLLLQAPELAKRVYISPKQKRDDTYGRLVALAHSHGIPVIENNEKIFRDLSGKDNVMVLAEFEKRQSDLDPQSNHVVLVNPSNMGNLGTILRCCAAFGVYDVAIVLPAADVYDPKVIRASMGAFFHMRVYLYASFEEYASLAGERSLYPFMLQGSASLVDVRQSGTFSLIFGNEATGLPESFLRVGAPVRIPQSSSVDSLNLDNAVAIGLYHFLYAAE